MDTFNQDIEKLNIDPRHDVVGALGFTSIPKYNMNIFSQFTEFLKQNPRIEAVGFVGIGTYPYELTAKDINHEAMEISFEVKGIPDTYDIDKNVTMKCAILDLPDGTDMLVYTFVDTSGKLVKISYHNEVFGCMMASNSLVDIWRSKPDTQLFQQCAGSPEYNINVLITYDDICHDEVDLVGDVAACRDDYLNWLEWCVSLGGDTLV